MSRATIEMITFPTDARGLVVEPLDARQIAAQKNVHLVITVPGGIRGNHYHHQGTEIVVVFGPALARLREGQSTRDIHVPPGQAYRFTIPPGVAHAFQNTGPQPTVLIAFNSQAFDPANPDLAREVLIPAPTA